MALVSNLPPGTLRISTVLETIFSLRDLENLVLLVNMLTVNETAKVWSVLGLESRLTTANPTWHYRINFNL